MKGGVFPVLRVLGIRNQKLLRCYYYNNCSPFLFPTFSKKKKKELVPLCERAAASRARGNVTC